MKKESFPIVALGASAGGIQALTEFFSSLSSELNLAFIVVTHLKRDAKSVLDKLLAKTTTMPVSWVSDDQAVEPNRVYVLPQNKYMTIEQGRLQLVDRDPLNRINNAIDIFFESLAKDKDGNSIGIIFSGAGSDGTQGAIHMYNQGGLVMAQDLATAEIDSMPYWVTLKDHVQFVSSPKKLAQALEVLATGQENPPPNRSKSQMN